MRAKNWKQYRVAITTGGYVNLIDTGVGGGGVNIDRRGLMIINDTANAILLFIGGETAPGSDTNSYSLAAGQSFDFLDQPPIVSVWAKAVGGNVSPLVLEG